jgi:hypothetical protein
VTETEWLAEESPNVLLAYAGGWAPPVEVATYADHPNWRPLVFREDPPVLLDAGRPLHTSERKLYLLAVGIVRTLYWKDLEDPRALQAAKAGEDYAEGRITAQQRRAAWGATHKVCAEEGGLSWVNILSVRCAADNPVRDIPAFYDFAGASSFPGVVPALVRCVLGNPFSLLAAPPPAKYSNPWLVASSIYREKDWVALPILADALEEAGYAEPPCGACGGAGRVTADDGWNCPDRCKACKGVGTSGPGVLLHLRSPGPHCRGCFAVDWVLGKK